MHGPYPTLSGEAEYATQPGFLQREIDLLLSQAAPPVVDGRVLGLIVPASNLLAGGKIAAQAYKSLVGSEVDAVILVEPDRTGSSRRLGICSVSDYFTPLGQVPVSDLIRNELCDEDDDIYLDDAGHYQHEGVDVQIPFLKTVLKSFSVVPIVMGEETPELCAELGGAVGEVMYGRNALVIACVDYFGGSPDGLKAFIAAFEALDVPSLTRLLNAEAVQFFGKGAIQVAVLAALRRRAVRGHVIAIQDPEMDRPGFFGALIVG